MCLSPQAALHSTITKLTTQALEYFVKLEKEVILRFCAESLPSSLDLSSHQMDQNTAVPVVCLEVWLSVPQKAIFNWTCEISAVTCYSTQHTLKGLCTPVLFSSFYCKRIQQTWSVKITIFFPWKKGHVDKLPNNIFRTRQNFSGNRVYIKMPPKC